MGEDDFDACGGMDVLLRRDGAEASIHVGQAYSPDVLADMSRHAVTMLGALYPEDDDEDLLADLETSWGAAPSACVNCGHVGTYHDDGPCSMGTGGGEVCCCTDYHARAWAAS